MSEELTVAVFNTVPIPALSDGDKERFWQQVQKRDADQCWPWGNNQNNEYGSVTVGGKSVRAHRLMWFIHTGQDPFGLHVLHRCDNPPCVNPAHLFLGTNKDNVRDCAEKGRRFTRTFVPEWERRRVQQRCHRGHSLSGSNLRIFKGHRHCLTCDRERLRANRDRYRNGVTIEQVPMIRQLVNDGLSLSDAANRFNLKRSTVATIVNSKPWIPRGETANG